MKMPTAEQIKAGNDIAAALFDADIAIEMRGLTGTIDGGVAVNLIGGANNDIVLMYADGKIDSCTAIYLAMQRATGVENLYHWVGPGQLLVRGRDEADSAAVLKALLERTPEICKQGTIEQWSCYAIVDEVEANTGIYYHLERIGARP